MNNQRFSKLLIFFIFFSFQFKSFSQCNGTVMDKGSVKLNEGIRLTFSGSNTISWNVSELFSNGSQSSFLNNSVASIRGYNGYTFNFGDAPNGNPALSDVIVTFNTCTAVGRSFYVCYATYNWWGTLVGQGSYKVNVVEPTDLLPQPVFNSIATDCQSIKFCVNNPKNGASYLWSNVNGSGSQVSGTCADFTGAPGAMRQVTATCGNVSKDPVSINGVGTNFPTGLSLTAQAVSGPNAPFCPDESIKLTATSQACIPNSSSWNWSINGIPSAYLNYGQNGQIVSGSVNTNVVNPGGSYGTISVTVSTTDIRGNNVTITRSLSILPATNPKCFNGGFLLKRDVTKNNNVGKDGKINGAESIKSDLSLSDIENSKFISQTLSIFPNPSNDMFIVSGLENIDEIRLINVQGQILQVHKIAEGATQQELKVAQYPNGLYLVQLKNTMGETRVEKVQINH